MPEAGTAKTNLIWRSFFIKTTKPASNEAGFVASLRASFNASVMTFRWFFAFSIETTASAGATSSTLESGGNW